MLTFNTDNMVHQRFDAFPAPIMDYILKELKPEHLLKLYQCCKFFYHKYRLNIIRNLEIVDDGEPEILDPFNCVLTFSNPFLSKIKDFWITDSIICKVTTDFVNLPKFTHCTVKKFVACNHLLLGQYDAVAKAGTIEELKIGYVDAEDEMIPVATYFDEILAKVPNATSIELSETFFSPTTFDTLLTLDYKAKISTLILHNIYNSSPILDNRDLFIEFLFKAAADDCKIHVDFELLPEESDEDRQHNDRIKELGNLYNEIIALNLQIKKHEREISAREV